VAWASFQGSDRWQIWVANLSPKEEAAYGIRRIRGGKKAFAGKPNQRPWSDVTATIPSFLITAASISALCISAYSAYFDACAIYLGLMYFVSVKPSTS
jgi:hypothetical protein